MHTIGSWWMWVGFIVFVLLILILDLFVMGGKKARRLSLREALGWSAIWMFCALLFCVFIWRYLAVYAGAEIAHQKALEFLTGYIIEQSLSVDNLFVFILIFNYFSVSPHYQRRVLLYGVLGAVIMRLIMILSGTWLVAQFHWLLYLFGVFLVFTGIKMLVMSHGKKDLEQNVILKFMRKHLRILHDYHGEKFFVKKDFLWCATPLFLVLVLVEISDLIFALDSIPAIFAVTNDPFIIFTSNIFAIMGLRALYFVLAHMAERFYLLKYGIAVVLTFVGIKMLIAPWLEIPILWALAIVMAILSTTMVLSWLAQPKSYQGKL
jgi:tellurite resistance protein TerC